MIRRPPACTLVLVDESTVDDPLSGDLPRGGLDFDVTEAAVLEGLFGAGTKPRVGRYRVVRPIGAGAMGQVFEAHDEDLDRAVALKLISGVRAGTERARGRFLREARALARVSHPNVVEVFEVGVHEDDVFIAMELLRGSTLRTWASVEARSWQEVLAVLLQVGDGLAAAHDKGLVHRDLKPDNVWVGDEGRARVIDFGLAMTGPEDEVSRSDSTLERALLTGSASDKLTRTGAAVGSPAYMSPEQLMRRGITEHSDQFAFCVTAFEVLHGKRPFAGATLPMLLHAVARGDIVRIDDQTPGWIDAALRRGLAAEPEARWPSMRALVDALRRGPGRRRLFWAGGAALLGTVLAGVGMVSNSEQACAEDLSEAWSSDRRGGLARRVQADGDAYAEAVQAPLDAFVQRWNEARIEACTAGPESEGFDAAVQCLDARREAFEAALEVLDTLEAGSLEQASRVVSGLKEIAPCGEEAPTSPSHAAALARASALSGAGRYQDAIEVAMEAAEDAPAGLRARLLFEAADGASSLGRGPEALSYAEPAYFEALRAGDERFACYVGGLLVGILGNDLEAFDAAAQWYARTSSLLERIEDDGRVHGKVEAYWASALYGAGRADEAVAAYDRAIAAAPNVPLLAAATRAADRANALLEAGRIDEGQAAHVEALGVFEAALGPSHPGVGVACDNVGTSFAMAGDFEAARPYFERALSVARLEAGTDGRIALALGNLGLLEYTTGRYESSKLYLEEALERFEAVEGPEGGRVLQTLSNLAVNAQARGDLDEAERTLWSVIERRRAKNGPDHPSIGVAKNTLGDNLYKQGRCEEAPPVFLDAIRIFEGASGPAHVDVAYPLTGLGRCEVVLGRHADARVDLERAIAIAEGKDDGVLHDARMSLIDALRAGAGSPDEARAVAAAALQAASSPEQTADARKALDALR